MFISLSKRKRTSCKGKHPLRENPSCCDLGISGTPVICEGPSNREVALHNPDNVQLDERQRLAHEKRRLSYDLQLESIDKPRKALKTDSRFELREPGPSSDRDRILKSCEQITPPETPRALPPTPPPTPELKTPSVLEADDTLPASEDFEAEKVERPKRSWPKRVSVILATPLLRIRAKLSRDQVEKTTREDHVESCDNEHDDLAQAATVDQIKERKRMSARFAAWSLSRPWKAQDPSNTPTEATATNRESTAADTGRSEFVVVCNNPRPSEDQNAREEEPTHDMIYSTKEILQSLDIERRSSLSAATRPLVKAAGIEKLSRSRSHGHQTHLYRPSSLNPDAFVPMKRSGHRRDAEQLVTRSL